MLTPFQNQVASWLRSKTVGQRAEDICWIYDYAKEPLLFPSEPAEPALTRLGRRLEYYAQAVGLRHPEGENFAVASVFAELCGARNLNFIVTVSGYISEAKIRYLKQLKSPTPPASEMAGTEQMEIAKLFLAMFQDCLCRKPTSWLAKTILGAPPAQMVGFVTQKTLAKKAWLTTAQWRITSDTIEILPRDYKVPRPKGRHWDSAYFGFSLPNEKGFGEYSISTAPLHFFARRYRITREGGIPKIEPGELTAMT
jgi:hypothetical protein